MITPEFAARQGTHSPKNESGVKKVSAISPTGFLRCENTRRARSGHGVCLSKPRRVSPPVRRKKVQSFSQATCAAEKILLGLQTPLSKKRRFFDSLTPLVCAYCTGSWGFSLFRALAAQGKEQQRQQRTGEIARRVEPDVRDLSAAAGDEELDRLVAERGERAGQQRSRP